jgi:hypothetical protein
VKHELDEMLDRIWNHPVTAPVEDHELDVVLDVLRSHPNDETAGEIARILNETRDLPGKRVSKIELAFAAAKYRCRA